MNNISIEKLFLWKENPTINPITKRKIKENGPSFKKFSKLYDKYAKNKKRSLTRYQNLRYNLIDPILLLELPLHNKNKKDIFYFKEKWNPFNGQRLNKDHDGPLAFDPCTLVHYFYVNRLKNLWIDETIENGEYFQGHYGDALGNGPDFEIKGRGKHPDWYLFRLPILDCYIEDNPTQAVTMGPILSDEEIEEIYKLSKRYNFKNIYGYKRPNLLKVKQLYDIAVNKVEYNEIEGISENEINIIKFQINSEAVERLKKL